MKSMVKALVKSTWCGKRCRRDGKEDEGGGKGYEESDRLVGVGEGMKR